MEKLLGELSKTVSKEVIDLREAGRDSYTALANAGKFAELNAKIDQDLIEATVIVAKAVEEAKQAVLVPLVKIPESSTL